MTTTPTTSASLALLRKNLVTTLRAPLVAVLSVLVPVAFATLYAVVVRVSTTAPVAVALDDASPGARAFVEVMRDLRNDDGPLYEVRETDPDRARALYAAGDVGALVTVPEGFGDRVAAGLPAQVRLDVVPINADGVKNQQLRLELAVRELGSTALAAGGGQVTLDERTVLAHDVPITDYLGTGLLVLAALYAGIITTGTTIAREWEDRTATELMLAPAGPGHALAGTWLSAAGVSLLTVAASAAGIGLALGFPLASLGWTTATVLAGTWAYGAAIGSLLGVTLRRALPLVPIGVVVAVAHFLVLGYESYLRGFAHGGATEALWRAAAWLGLGRLVDAARFEVADLGASPDGLATAALAGAALTATLTWVAARLLRRALAPRHGQ